MRVGDAVTIQTDSYPDVFHGRISYVAAALDPNTRTLQARIETGNPGGKLKKDMYVVATVDAGTIQNAIAVPDAAVLRDTENQPFVYVEVSANQFGRRSVVLGEGLSGQTQITSGLNPGEHVVGKWQLVPAVCELAAALAEQRLIFGSIETAIRTVAPTSE